MKELIERFLRYVKVMTPSCEESDTTPSSRCQFDLAELLVKEMREMGISDARVDEKCYVYGSLPATAGRENCPAIGFIAHMDTVSDFMDHPVVPVLHENYDGEELALGTSGRVLSPKEFPHLKELKGRTLITTDGTTILGADDKAGIAEILTMAQVILEEKRPHGKLCFAFTPDEETGNGAANFDVKGFGADFAYTLDGGKEGGIEFENFNAAAAVVSVKGVNVHPGSAKDVMVNAGLTAMEFNGMLPKEAIPRETDGYQGFYHLLEMKGDVAEAELKYIIRDHDPELFQEKLDWMKEIAEKLNEKYGDGTVTLAIRQQYRNMREQIEPHMHLIHRAEEAARACGMEPETLPIRGGTDGAALSFMGLPCPNLGTGGYCYHGPYEHITVEGMVLSTELLLKLAELYAEV